MQLFLRGIDGSSATRVVEETTTVAELKQSLDLDTEFHLSYAGKDCPEIATCGALFSNECTIEVNADLLGAGKKRKKKQYTKPKKVAHKHKKVKLGVLKFYKVDGSDKITRLRKDCPNCGPGVFMAMHHNRYYCGRCTLTYVFKENEEA
ncbi:unnamed protein product [Amoebophrya sp. A120]|nr:unnamed protein product [Amoebophrya sp. A120]|eukprot:GSA120T00011377001.1